MAVVLWKIAGRTIELGERALIMGVLNVTPDSFSDGGRFLDRDTAVEQGRRMIAEGADIVDIGGESTRPGADDVSGADELARVVPVIEQLRGADNALISIDTMKAQVARAALGAGATIINDVSGGRGDPKMMPLAAESSVGFVIMHMQGTPRTMQTNPHYDDVVSEVAEFFRQQYSQAVNSGIDPMTIAFDPGIGFGKTLQHNLELLRNLPRLRVENRPLVVGVSRKSFLGRVINSSEMADRTAPTIAMTALLRERGADVIRVHDVKDNVAALRTTEALLTPAR